MTGLQPLDDSAAARARERALVWKIDLLLMPLLTISFGLQYYDSAILGSAAIFGIIEDLGLSTVLPSGAVSTLRYSTATAAFYWSYLVASLPFALLLQRLPLGKTLGVCIFIWGTIVMLTVVCKNFAGLVVQRLFLGAIEASVSPGFVLVTSLWYTKAEQTTRLGIWYSATGIFSIFSSALNYGLGSITGGSLASWQYMYLFAGSVTMIWGVVVFLLLPDSPSKPGRFFTEADRKLMLDRASRNQTGLDRKPFNWAHVTEAVRDPKLYLFFLMASAIYVVNGGVTAFGARIVKSFGYSSLTTILIMMPGGAVTMATIYLFGWAAGRWKDARTWLLPLSCIPVVVGALVIWLASWAHRGVPLFGFFLLASFGAPYVLLLSLNSANVAGGTKRSILTGAIFVGYNVGNIIGPYLVFTPEKPIKYRSTWIAVLVVMVVSSLLSLVLRAYLVRENRKRDARDAAAAAPRAVGDEDEKAGGREEDASEYSILEDDRTDFTNPAFRYSL